MLLSNQGKHSKLTEADDKNEESSKHGFNHDFFFGQNEGEKCTLTSGLGGGVGGWLDGWQELNVTISLIIHEFN